MTTFNQEQELANALQSKIDSLKRSITKELNPLVKQILQDEHHRVMKLQDGLRSGTLLLGTPTTKK